MSLSSIRDYYDVPGSMSSLYGVDGAPASGNLSMSHFYNKGDFSITWLGRYLPPSTLQQAGATPAIYTITDCTESEHDNQCIYTFDPSGSTAATWGLPAGTPIISFNVHHDAYGSKLWVGKVNTVKPITGWYFSSVKYGVIGGPVANQATYQTSILQGGAKTNTGTGVFDTDIYFHVRNSKGQELTWASRVSMASRSGSTGGGGGGCFAVGSKVLLATGEWVNIESLRVGDEVMSFRVNGIDESNKEPKHYLKYQFDKLDGAITTSRVKKALLDHYHNYYIINGEIKVTYEHPVFIERLGKWFWCCVRDLQVGDKMLRADGGSVVVESVFYVDGHLDVVSLDVEDVDTYFVQGILAHNADQKD